MGKLISLPEDPNEECELGVKKTVKEIIVDEDKHRFIQRPELDYRENAKRAIKNNEFEETFTV